MNACEIHPTAIVDPKALLAEGVKIGPYCVVGPNVEIGEDTELHAHVILDGHMTIGKNNKFFQFCSIGAPPQDLTYNGEPTRVEIGDNNIFREYVSIHRGTMKDQKVTIIKNDCLLMAHAHIGHDVVLGNRCVIVNSVNFAGHVKVGDRTIIGGGTNISQFVSIGRGAYLGGASAIDRDIPPFCTAYGNRARLKGINIIGLRRHEFDRQMITEVVDFYRAMESSAYAPRAFVEHEEMLTEFFTNENEVIQELIDFVKKSEIGIAPFMSS